MGTDLVLPNILSKYDPGEQLRSYCSKFLAVESLTKTSFCSYARPAQPGPNRTRLCGPCIAAIAGD